MPEEYITITSEYFQPVTRQLKVSPSLMDRTIGFFTGKTPERTIPFETDSEARAIEWKGLIIPDVLRILGGYQRPEYSEVGGGFPEFKDWLQRTLATGNEKTIRDSMTFLQLKTAYYDWLYHIDDYLSKDGRIHGRLEEGLGQLRGGLEALTSN